jgi:hypothetical protein
MPHSWKRLLSNKARRISSGENHADFYWRFSVPQLEFQSSVGALQIEDVLSSSSAELRGILKLAAILLETKRHGVRRPLI